MRRLALIAACLVAGGGLAVVVAPSQASALTPAGLQNAAMHDNGVVLARRGGGGFRGGGFRGGRSFAFRGGRGFHGHAFRGGRAFAFRGGPGFRRGFRGGRVYAFRGGRHWGHRRGWRGPGWRWGTAAVAAPFFYGGWGNCPLVRRTVWTPYGWRVRWVRRCW